MPKSFILIRAWDNGMDIATKTLSHIWVIWVICKKFLNEWKSLTLCMFFCNSSTAMISYHASPHRSQIWLSLCRCLWPLQRSSKQRQKWIRRNLHDIGNQKGGARTCDQLWWKHIREHTNLAHYTELHWLNIFASFASFASFARIVLPRYTFENCGEGCQGLQVCLRKPEPKNPLTHRKDQKNWKLANFQIP